MPSKQRLTKAEHYWPILKVSLLSIICEHTLMKYSYAYHSNNNTMINGPHHHLIYNDHYACITNKTSNSELELFQSETGGK